MRRSGAAILLALNGCATALSGSQPAHVPPKGHVQAELGFDISVSAGSIDKVVAAAGSADEAARTRTLTDEERWAIMEGGAHLGLNPPALIPHLGAAYSFADRWEVGLRFSASGVRLAVRRQLLEQGSDGIDATVGFGFGPALFTPPIHDVLKSLEVTSFSRWNFDLPATMGRHGSWYRWWVGPRLAFSVVAQQMRLTYPGAPAIDGAIAGRGFYVGACAGAALGYRSVFVGPEITLVQLIGSADVTAFGSASTVPIASFVIYPSFSVMAEL